MTQAEYARHLERRYGKKITRQGINKLMGNVIPARPDRKIDPAEADAAMVRRGLLQMPQDAGQEPPPPAAADAEPAEPGLPLEAPAAQPQRGEDRNARPMGYWDVKAETEAVQKKLLDLKYEEAIGQLVRTADVMEAMVAAGRKIRTAMEALPGLADELAAAALSGGSHEVRVVLRSHIRQLEQRIADALTLMADEPEEGGDDAQEGA